MHLLAASSGIVSGKLAAADLFFLIAAIVFAIALLIRLVAKPIPIDGVCIAGGLFAVALGWLLL